MSNVRARAREERQLGPPSYRHVDGRDIAQTIAAEAKIKHLNVRVEQQVQDVALVVNHQIEDRISSHGSLANAVAS